MIHLPGMKPLLETKRLQLIPLELKDLEWLHQAFTNEFVRKYLWDNVIIPREKTEEILLINQQYFETLSWGLWKIVTIKEKLCVGFVGLWFFFEEPQPQLLYGLLPEYTGRGYATEASGAVIDYTFDNLKFRYLVAACDTPHRASQKVCDRLGMIEVEKKKRKVKPRLFPLR